MATVLQPHAAGLTAYETGGLSRAMHALRDGAQTWLVDPFHDRSFEDAVAELPPVAGVLQLLDRHNRDCAAIAGTLGVPLHKVPRSVPDSGLEIIPVVAQRFWNEVALWMPAARALVIAEAVGTAPLFGLGRPAGLHPLMRPFPPRSALGGFGPELLLVGHGPALATGASAALDGALRHARGDFPKVLLRLPAVLRG